MKIAEENKNRKVVIVSENMCSHEANNLYGDRYGYDWVYHPISSFKTAKEVVNEEFEKALPTDEISEIYIRAMEKYASQFKPTPSSTVDLEREAEELYPYMSTDKVNHSLFNAIQSEKREAYIKGRQTTSQKGLEELIEWMNKKRISGSEAIILRIELITKATELLTKK